ncbi:hypothetical protein IAD21_04208 [Abditibacteriota bacterium]|nr:hypothetical protein IAD21_04208 [Abditibacteriota bacterium]
MKIRYCPGCAELVHFESSSPIQRCWNCGQFTNFDMVKTPDQRLGLWLLAQIPHTEALMLKVPLPFARVTALSKTLLIVGVPAVVTMLLVSNSFNVRIVHDLTASFTMP